MSQVIVTTHEELTSLISSAVRRELGAIVRQTATQKTVFTEKEAAEYLNQAASTLRQWRSLSRGPAYLKDKRGIRYSKSDLDTWLAANRTYTAEATHD